MHEPTLPVELFPPEWLEAGLGGCCYGSINGPEYCTCWEPVYNLEQLEPVAQVTRAECPVRSELCGDCAYRRDSPERTGDDYVEENLLELAGSDNVFFCHTGMRRPIAYVHPDGRRLEIPDETRFHNYQPVQIDGVPYKADGTPGEICGGWAKLDRRVRAR